MNSRDLIETARGPSASLTLTVTVEYAWTGAAPSWRLEWMRTLREASE